MDPLGLEENSPKGPAGAHLGYLQRASLSRGCRSAGNPVWHGQEPHAHGFAEPAQGSDRHPAKSSDGQTFKFNSMGSTSVNANALYADAISTIAGTRNAFLYIHPFAAWLLRRAPTGSTACTDRTSRGDCKSFSGNNLRNTQSTDGLDWNPRISNIWRYNRPYFRSHVARYDRIRSIGHFLRCRRPS